MDMEDQICCVRTAAREVFEKHCLKSRERQRDGDKSHIDRVEARRKWKDLSEARMLHACRYAAMKAAEANKAVAMKYSRKLGTSATDVAKGWMITRLERLRFLQNRIEKSKKNKHPSTNDDDVRAAKPAHSRGDVEIVITILPEWICEVRAEHHATHLRKCAALEALNSPALIVAGPMAPVDDLNGYAQYVARASTARSCGVLISAPFKVSSKHAVTIAIDTPKAMLALYSSRPEEVYRRVSSKRFARYRRSKTQLEIAEAEMCRRRGADRLNTARGNNDPTVMAFDGGDHAYAHSTRITEAPRLRGRMVRKYTTSEPQPLVARPEGIERAIEFAENAPMFHTRVMDRFR